MINLTEFEGDMLKDLSQHEPVYIEISGNNATLTQLYRDFDLYYRMYSRDVVAELSTRFTSDMLNHTSKKDPYITGGLAQGIAGPVAGILAASNAVVNNEKLDVLKEQTRRQLLEMSAETGSAGEKTLYYAYKINDIVSSYRSHPKYLAQLEREKEDLYYKAVGLLANPASKPEKVKEARNIFLSLKDYKDSSVRADDCIRNGAKAYNHVSLALAAGIAIVAFLIFMAFFNAYDTKNGLMYSLYLGLGFFAIGCIPLFSNPYRDILPTLPRRQLTEEEKKARAAVRKRNAVIGIASCLALAVGIGFYVRNTVVVPAQRYKQAVSMMESDKYSDAITAFAALGDYKDSAEMINEVHYQEASDLMAKEKYREAEEIFRTLDDYKDSSDKIWECNDAAKQQDYDSAKALLEDGKYEEAEKAFTELASYQDSPDMVKECEYQKASKLLKEGNIEQAQEIFTQLGNYSDSTDMIKECQYQKANKLLEGRKYDEAEETFAALKGYSDSKEKIKECKYQTGLLLISSEKYEEAKDIFTSLSDYKDSSDQVEICIQEINGASYEEALELQKKGEYKKAAEIFEGLDNFKDSAQKLEECNASMTKENYDNAVALKEERKYSDAIEAFSYLGDYQDAKSQIVLCEILPFADAQAGDYIPFGKYHNKSLYWKVLAREDNSLLLVATDCVASMGFQNDQNHPTYYADSRARAFLTGKFTEESFTPEQQQLIETRDLPTTGGDVSDKIFLLSDQEAGQYFSSDEQRKVSEQYFLRTANEVQTSTSTRVIAMIVNGAGAIEQVNNSTDYDRGIRPAMWLNVSRYVDACQLLKEGNSEEATELLKSVNGIKGSSDIDYESMEKKIGKYQTALCTIQTEQNCTLKEADAEIAQYPNRVEIYQEDAGITSMINMLVKCEGTYKLGTDTLSVVFSYHEGTILAKVKYSGFPGEFIANESFTMLSNSGKLDDTIGGVKIRMGGANPNTGIFEYYTFTFIPDEVQAVSESTGKSVILKYVSDED